MAPAHLFLQMLSNGSSLRWVFFYWISVPCYPGITLPAVLACCRQAIRTKGLPSLCTQHLSRPAVPTASRREGLAGGSCPFGAAREIRMAGIPCVPNRNCMAVNTLTPPQDQSPSLVRSLPACSLSLLQASYQNKGTPFPLHLPPVWPAAPPRLRWRNLSPEKGRGEG